MQQADAIRASAFSLFNVSHIEDTNMSRTQKQTTQRAAKHPMDQSITERKATAKWQASLERGARNVAELRDEGKDEAQIRSMLFQMHQEIPRRQFEQFCIELGVWDARAGRKTREVIERLTRIQALAPAKLHDDIDMVLSMFKLLMSNEAVEMTVVDALVLAGVSEDKAWQYHDHMLVKDMETQS